MTRSRRSVMTWIAVLAIIMFAGLISFTQAAPGGGRVQLQSSDQEIFRDELMPLGTFAAGANTPVVGSWVCLPNGNFDLFSLDLIGPVGTMTGTGPTLAVVIDNSTDGGTSSFAAFTYTVINATVTPVTQHGVVSDLAGPVTTAQAYGDCWRARYTAGGTTPGGTLEVHMFAKDSQS